MKGVIVAAAVLILSAAAALFVYDTVKINENYIPSEAAEPVVYSEGTTNTYFPSVQTSYIRIANTLQLPELPTGCECTSLSMVLNYYGFDTDKSEIAEDYLEKSQIYKDDNNILRGPDFRYVFVGDPESAASFGCLAPCMKKTAEKFLMKNGGSGYTVKDITGTDFYNLFYYIENRIPVMIWSTQGLKKPQYITSWKTPEGKKVTWPTNEHCIVLSGFSYTDNTVRVNDPLDGVMLLGMDKVKECYDLMGQNALIIIKE